MNQENRLYIVFGFEHYNPLGIIRSLGEVGKEVIGIIIKSRTEISSKSKYLSKLHLVNDIEEGYNLLIKEYSNEKLKPFIFTSDDQITSFLDKKYDELFNSFIFFNAGSAGRITEFMEKDVLNNLAANCKIRLPKSWTVSCGQFPKDLKYPIVTKAIHSTFNNWKDESFICYNKDELKEAYKKIKSKKIILQEYISKKNELCLDGFSVNKGKDVFYAIASNYIDIIDGRYSNYMMVKKPYNSEIENKLNNMFKRIGFEGIFSVEFLIDENDNLYFLEINFRNSTWSYASTKAGMNLPLLWSSAMIDKNIMNKSHVEFSQFTAMAELNDYNDRVRTHKISFSDWNKQRRECKCLFLYAKNDKGPVVSLIKSIVKNKLKKIFGIK